MESHEQLTFYRRMAEIQDKIKKHEAERKQIQQSLCSLLKNHRTMNDRASLRKTFSKFLDDEKRRKKRNEKLMSDLEHIEKRKEAVLNKTQRLKALKVHFNAYMARTYPEWSDSKIINEHSNKKIESDTFKQLMKEKFISHNDEKKLINRNSSEGRNKIENQVPRFERQSSGDNFLGDDEMFRSPAHKRYTRNDYQNNEYIQSANSDGSNLYEAERDQDDIIPINYNEKEYELPINYNLNKNVIESVHYDDEMEENVQKRYKVNDEIIAVDPPIVVSYNYSGELEENNQIQPDFNSDDNSYLKVSNLEYQKAEHVSKLAYNLQQEIPKVHEQNVPYHLQQDIPGEHVSKVPYHLQKKIPEETVSKLPYHLQEEIPGEHVAKFSHNLQQEISVDDIESDIIENNEDFDFVEQPPDDFIEKFDESLKLEDKIDTIIEEKLEEFEDGKERKEYEENQESFRRLMKSDRQLSQEYTHYEPHSDVMSEELIYDREHPVVVTSDNSISESQFYNIQNEPQSHHAKADYYEQPVSQHYSEEGHYEESPKHSHQPKSKQEHYDQSVNKQSPQHYVQPYEQQQQQYYEQPGEYFERESDKHYYDQTANKEQYLEEVAPKEEHYEGEKDYFKTSIPEQQQQQQQYYEQAGSQQYFYEDSKQTEPVYYEQPMSENSQQQFYEPPISDNIQQLYGQSIIDNSQQQFYENAANSNTQQQYYEESITDKSQPVYEQNIPMNTKQQFYEHSMPDNNEKQFYEQSVPDTNQQQYYEHPINDNIPRKLYEEKQTLENIEQQFYEEPITDSHVYDQPLVDNTQHDQPIKMEPEQIYYEGSKAQDHSKHYYEEQSSVGQDFVSEQQYDGNQTGEKYYEQQNSVQESEDQQLTNEDESNKDSETPIEYPVSYSDDKPSDILHLDEQQQGIAGMYIGAEESNSAENPPVIQEQDEFKEMEIKKATIARDDDDTLHEMDSSEMETLSQVTPQQEEPVRPASSLSETDSVERQMIAAIQQPSVTKSPRSPGKALSRTSSSSSRPSSASSRSKPSTPSSTKPSSPANKVAASRLAKKK